MAVRPAGVLALGRPRRVEPTRLDHEDEGSLRVTTSRDLILSRHDLSESAADMHGAGLVGRLRTPRDRAVERPVHLDHARAVAEPRQAPAVATLHPWADDLEHGAWARVEEDGARRRKVVQGRDRMPGHDITPKRPQLCGQSIRQLLGAAAHERPARDMRRYRQDEPERGGGELVEGDHRMGAESAEERARGFAPETPPREPRRRPERGEPEAGHRQWVAR